MRNTIKTDMICIECGNIHVIQRNLSYRKKTNNEMKLWCYKCQKEVNHVEIIDKNSYLFNLEGETNLTEQEKEVLTLISNDKDKQKVKKYDRFMDV